MGPALHNKVKQPKPEPTWPAHMNVTKVNDVVVKVARLFLWPMVQTNTTLLVSTSPQMVEKHIQRRGGHGACPT